MLNVATLAGPIPTDEHRATDHVVIFHIVNNNPITAPLEVPRTIFFAFLGIVTIGGVL